MTCDDEQAIAQLVALSETPRPEGPILLAEVDGEPRAALAVAGGQVLADPYRANGELLELLALRAARLREHHAAGYQPAAPRVATPSTASRLRSHG